MRQISSSSSSSHHHDGGEKVTDDLLGKQEHQYQKDQRHQIRRRSSVSSITSTISSTKNMRKKQNKNMPTALRINTRSKTKRPTRILKERKVFSPSDLHESRRKSRQKWSTTRNTTGRSSSIELSVQKKKEKKEEIKKYPYKAIEMSIKNQLKRLKHLLHFVQVYEAQGWSASMSTSIGTSTNSDTKLKPNTELENAHKKIVKGKRLIKDSLQELVSLYGKDKQFDFLANDCSNVQPEDICCSHCFGTETNEHNDILLCDFEGCNRAYHQKCQDPPIETKDIPIDEEEWYCHICEAIFQCLREINFVFDTEYEDIKDVFPELFAEEEMLLQEQHERDKLRQQQQILLEEDDDEEEDEDFVSDEIVSSENAGSDSDSDTNEDEPKVLLSQEEEEEEEDAITTCEEEVSEEEMAYLKSSSSDAIIDLHKRSLRSHARSKKLEIGGEEEEIMDTNLIIQGKRKRANVDYCALNELLFSGKNDSDIEEGEEYLLQEKKEEEQEEVDEDEEKGEKGKQMETVTSGRAKRYRTIVNYRLLHGGEDERED